MGIEKNITEADRLRALNNLCSPTKHDTFTDVKTLELINRIYKDRHNLSLHDLDRINRFIDSLYN
jgi:hypothetical protein